MPTSCFDRNTLIIVMIFYNGECITTVLLFVTINQMSSFTYWVLLWMRNNVFKHYYSPLDSNMASQTLNIILKNDLSILCDKDGHNVWAFDSGDTE